MYTPQGSKGKFKGIFFNENGGYVKKSVVGIKKGVTTLRQRLKRGEF